VVAKKGLVRQDAGQQQRKVPLNHYQKEDGVETITTDDVGKKIEMHVWEK
jgi:hypothetical protein